MTQQQPSKQPVTDAKLAAILTRTAIVVWLEAAAVGAFGVFLLWGLVSGQSKSIAAEATLVALYAAAAVWVAYIGVALRHGKRWARSAAVFWQTCQLFIASQSFSGRGANNVIGVLLIASSVFVLAHVFSRRVIQSSRGEIESGN
ncbi:MAG: hypothetical protein KGL72_03330 [Actinomycetales bacterium]|nr:hypothetical protein [Actinomycetales bacterium]